MFERDLTAVAAYFHETWPTFTRTRICDPVATAPHVMAGALYTMEEVLDILDEPMLPGSDDEFLLRRVKAGTTELSRSRSCMCNHEGRAQSSHARRMLHAITFTK